MCLLLKEVQSTEEYNDTNYKEMYSGEYTADDVTDTIDEGDCLSDE